MGVREFIELLRGVDRLLTLEAKHGRAIDTLAAELDALKARVSRLEAREDIVIVEAKAAAGSAAGAVAMQAFSDMARRIGRLEARNETRLDPP